MSGSKTPDSLADDVQIVSSPRIKILALCDSPTVTTGFARVAKNVLARWVAGPNCSIEVDCWALHFEGWFYDGVPFKLLPGGDQDWNSARRLSHFLQVLDQGDYTHVWMLMDPDALSVHGFPAKLREVCAKRKIRWCFIIRWTRRWNGRGWKF